MSNPIDRQAAIEAIDWASKIPIHDLSDGRGFCRVIFADDFLKALKTIPLAQSRWIPCSEKMPEALQEVLVTSTHGHVYTSRIVHGDFEYGGNVLAWMPLPEPYKGEET